MAASLLSIRRQGAHSACPLGEWAGRINPAVMAAFPSAARAARWRLHMLIDEETILLAGCARLVGRQPIFAHRGGFARRYQHRALSIVQAKLPGQPEVLDVRFGSRETVARFEIKDSDRVVVRYLDREVMPHLVQRVTHLVAGV